MAHDVFISHSSQDKLVADAICARLESAGIRCWVAPRDILPSESWAEAIVKAITSSRAVVVVVSKNAMESRPVLKEVERAIHYGAVVVPFRIEKIDLSKDMEFFLSSVHWLDAVDPPMKAHLDRLAAAVAHVLNVRADQTQAEHPLPLRRGPGGGGSEFEEVPPDEWDRKKRKPSIFSKLFDEG